MATDMGGFAQAGGPVLVDQFGRPLKASAALNYRRDDLTAAGGETVVEMTSPARNLKVYKNSTLLKLSEYTINSSVQFTLGSALALNDVLTVEYQSAYSQDASYLVPLTTDPLFAYVQSLLHFDGADGSTTFTDQTGKVWTPSGNAQIDTARAKFGGASGLFDGSGDFISTPHNSSLNLSSGDWTIECWLYLDVSTSGNQMIVNKDGVFGSSYPSYDFFVSSSLKLGVGLGSGNGTSSYQGITSSASISTGAWVHVAAVRSAGNILLFINGNLDSTTAITTTITDGGKAVFVGNYASNVDTKDMLHGSIDDLRITKGVARYTANFTPPSAPFPDS